MNESSFIAAVHKKLPKGIYAEKMFNPMRGGTPDCWYSSQHGDLWVEYKFFQQPPSIRGYGTGLSELQKHWLHERWKEGRNVAAIIGTPRDGAVYIEDDFHRKKIYPCNFMNYTSSVDCALHLILRKLLDPTKPYPTLESTPHEN